MWCIRGAGHALMHHNSEAWCSELAEALTNVFFANEHKVSCLSSKNA